MGNARNRLRSVHSARLGVILAVAELAVPAAPPAFDGFVRATGAGELVPDFDLDRVVDAGDRHRRRHTFVRVSRDAVTERTVVSAAPTMNRSTDEGASVLRLGIDAG